MQAAELGALLRRYDLRTHVNLIPWNAVAGSPYERPSNNAVHRFADALRNEHRVPTSIRVTRGTASAGSERHDLDPTLMCLWWSDRWHAWRRGTQCKVPKAAGVVLIAMSPCCVALHLAARAPLIMVKSQQCCCVDERRSGSRVYRTLTLKSTLCAGTEAAAACGQLRNQHQKDPLPAFAVPA